MFHRGAIAAMTVGVNAVWLAPVWAADTRDWAVDPIVKTHTVAAVTRLSGPGGDVQGLPMTYDMSLFEWNWGGRQATFNGSGVTTNSNFPLVEGEAISTNDDVGVEVTSPSGVVLGMQGEWYGLAGDRTVGRVFGEELPWDNFASEGGQLVPARSNLDLDRAWLRTAQAPWSVQLTAGTLPPQTLPEFTRKPMNQLRLGSLVWRPPITNASFFEKEDRKLEEGRHPIRGADLIADYEYADARHLHLELFTGRTKPTPVAGIERLSSGGRLGVDVGRGNVGVTFIRADGDQPRAERQDQWAVDTSYPLLAWVIPYGAVARSSYTRGSTNLDGTAVVGGVAVKGPRKVEAKVQYQWLGENYDLIGTHKTEHYPTNLRGIQAEATGPVGQMTVKGIVYHLRQMETTTRTGDTIFGDSYFPALANSQLGTITMWRLGGETRRWSWITPKGYVEQAHFRKDALADADDIDKLVTSVSLGANVPLTTSLAVELGWRHLIATGRWQAMRFHHRQEIPELAVSYTRGNDLRATLIYHHYAFQDSIAAAQGNNDYTGDQVIGEIRYVF